MKKYIYFIIACFVFVSCNKKSQDVYMFTSFREPANEGLRFLFSYDGYHWDSIPGVFLVPEVGVQKIMRDPSIVRGPDGVFHLVWTCSWKDDPGFGYASSKDLIHWSPQKYIPIMQHEPSVVNVWAPELFYDEDKQDFIVVWASTVPYIFEKGVEDEFNNHRLYYTRTKDFKQFSEPQVIFDPGYSSIDAVIVKRSFASYILVFKDNTRPERNLRAAFGTTPIGPYSRVSVKPFTEPFTEGPAVVRVKNEWLIYYDAYREHTYEAVSTSDFITFTNINNKISIPAGHKHGTIFMANSKILNKMKKK